MDKWLWAARFFKTRALAARACELGRIQSNGQPAKAARDVRIGDMLRVTNDSGDFEVEVLLLSEMRGPASVAQTLYRETEASRELRLKLATERKAMQQFEESPASRPTKRDRRRIIQFRGRAWPRAKWESIRSDFRKPIASVFPTTGSCKVRFNAARRPAAALQLRLPSV